MGRVLLVKHAESTWNAAARWQGWADPPLSEQGERQAELAATALREWRWARVVSSDLVRALRTTDILARALDLGPAVIDPRLREYDVGEWVGLTRDEIEARWPGALAAWRRGRLDRVPGGERWDSFDARVRSVLDELLRGEDTPILAITHGGVLDAAAVLTGTERTTAGNLAGRWFKASGAKLRAGEPVDLLGMMASRTAPLRFG